MVRAQGRGRRGGRRGRGGRGRGGRGRGNNVNIVPVGDTQVFDEDKFDWDQSNDVEADGMMRKLFIDKSKFSLHYEAQNKYPHRYFACLHVLIKNNVQLLESSKSIALAAAWARKDFTMAEFLLKIPNELFGIKEVLKALTTLDAARNKRALEKLLKRLEAQGCKKKQKMISLKSLIGSLEAEIAPIGSVSGALIRHVKLWLKTIPAERLEFYAMQFPPEPWKKLADICHLNPDKDFPQCPWFLKYCFGEATLPQSSVVAESSKLNEGNTSDMILLGNDIDYTVARKYHTSLTPEAKERISKYSKLDTVLWYYEELGCDNVEKVIYDRLKNGETSNLPYGKLMERILYFTYLHKVKENPWSTEVTEKENCEDTTLIDEITELLMKEADNMLKDIKFNLEDPVVVIGDMSGSMQVAIHTSNIIASLVTAVCNADLVFFNDVNVVPSFIPKDVEGVMRLCEEIDAHNCTNPAASLYPYYEQKKIVKTFVIVTDEGENGRCHGHDFAELFKLYHDEVYPARLVFISFLSQADSGTMISALKRHAPEINPMQFRFSVERPDLTKLDNVFGTLSSENEGFSKQVDEIITLFIEKDLEKTLQILRL